MACVAKGLSRQDAHEEIRSSPPLKCFQPNLEQKRKEKKEKKKKKKKKKLTEKTPITGVLSHQASDNVKKQGKSNDLIDRIRRAAFFEPILPDLDNLLDPSTFIGRAPQQVDKFVSTEVAEALKPYRSQLVKDVAELHV